MRKVLIVDDDKIFTKVLKDSLTGQSDREYEVCTAENGEEGFAMLKEEKPDLVVLDIVMPKVGGVEFLEKMQEDDTVGSTPVIVSTQLSDVEQMSKVVRFGVKGYIIKSEFSLENIVNQINDFFESNE